MCRSCEWFTRAERERYLYQLPPEFGRLIYEENYDAKEENEQEQEQAEFPKG